MLAAVLVIAPVLAACSAEEEQAQHRAPGCADIGPAPVPTPEQVILRQGVPTRITIGDGYYRFGINSSDEAAETIYFTVLIGKDIEGFEVAEGDLVGAAGVCWRAVELEADRLVLEPAPSPSSPGGTPGS
jgi:hypothetical protein